VLRLNPKQKLSAADQKMYADAVKQAQFKTKEARGQLKSFGIKVAAFKKSAAQFGDANRKAAEKAYSEAAKALKQSEADGKKIAQVETKAIKHLDAITKLK
jgi:hypothetical protein